MSKDNGGPAFPFILDNADGSQVWHNGMTLRDYFAAHAPEPPAFFPVVETPWNPPIGYLGDFHKEWSQRNTIATMIAWRWAYADAMLAERAK